ncbi:MAG: hypothetical protein NTU41_09225, partial [Chloroflexi bacterium]|nr:hypothetical protein [Chloroflexota bacterium]
TRLTVTTVAGAATVSMTMTKAQSAQAITFSGGASGKTGTSSAFTVNPGSVDHYLVPAVSSPQVVGTAFAVTLQAQDVYSNSITSGAQAAETLNITFSSADSGATPTSATTSGGSATVSLKMAKDQSAQSILFTGATSGKKGATGSFVVLAAEMSSSTLVVSSFTAQTPTVVDALDEAGVSVSFSGTGTVTGTVQIAGYAAVPTSPTIAFSTTEASGGTGRTPVKYVDVRVSGFSAGTASITVSYAGADVADFSEKDLALYYWDGSKWEEAGNRSVDTANKTVTGDVPVSALSGTPVAIGGSSPSSPAALIGGIVGGVVVILVLVYLVVIRRKPAREAK